MGYKKICLYLAMLCLCICAQAQNEIKVKEIVLKENDLEARTNQKNDINDNPCALVKIAVPRLQGMVFKSVIDTLYTPGVYKVYLPAGTKRLKFQHKDYQPGVIEFPKPLESLCVYMVTLDVPLLAETYEDCLATARKYNSEYRSHTESSYYDAARTAYDKVLEHKDCPHDVREELWAERNKMAAVRKLTYLRERAEFIVDSLKRASSYDSDECYKYIGISYKICDSLYKTHPEIVGVSSLKTQSFNRYQSHPKSKYTVSESKIVHRKVVTGVVTFKSKIHPPVQSIHIFACKSSKPEKATQKMIGGLKEDGSYSVVMPDGYSYIYFDGEKAAHYVSGDKLDVEL